MIINHKVFSPFVKGAILDIDGVLVRGSEVISGSVKAVSKLNDMGIHICYLTNNPTRSREDISSFLEDLGFFQTEKVVTSGMAVSEYVLENMGISRILVIGEAGLVRELERSGHTVVPAGGANGSCHPVEHTVDCVVCSLDRRFDYTKLTEGLWALRNGASFFATNRDPTLPHEKGKVLPGGGSIVAALERASGKKPFVVGKPYPYSTSMAVRLLGLDPSDVLMIGDRYDTDIAAGRAAGTEVAMVLSGDTKECPEEVFPCYPELASLVEDLYSRRG